MPKRRYYVYILTNVRATVFYTGMTDDLRRRLAEHRAGVYERAFSKRYRTYRLVYYEQFATPRAALNRERQLKRWRRAWKIDLIRAANPSFRDLAVSSLPS